MLHDESTTSKLREGNAYEVKLSPARNRLLAILAAVGLITALIVGFTTSTPSLWGLLPIALYAVLALLSMDIVVATVIALLSGLLILQPAPVEVGNLLGDSLGEFITTIGLIIMLGAGVGEILKETGVASTIVKGVMRAVGERNMMAVTFGVMLACGILVASLGTLAGAIAIAAPILLPITARLGFTKSATASMLFIGGGAGLAMAPFAGSNVVIMGAADVTYIQYVLFGGGPLALLSLALGPFIVRWIQSRTANQDDYYDADEFGGEEVTLPAHAGRTTIVFAVVLLVSVGYAVLTAAGTSFPLLALPTIGIVTAMAARLSIADTVNFMYRGATKLISIFILFWLLAALFLVIDLLAPFDVILENYGGALSNSSPFVFAILIAMLGWVGVPGATAAQVVLLDEVFGGIGATLGITAASWVVILLFASKADTYGPFPNANMIGVMGLARSTNLKNMLITGWMLLVPACIMYGTILFFQTR
ncbi:Na+/H+ antiporter NhaC family protein [Arthrobacter sp. H5]|uniref:Na+/H+ antiporter NhaC family protein n=1 Tax=Arthrobacter sp. H5 TaxID=1267973 RepID=UPI000484F28C|nr:Na+/H+ antiporter NhaC family protein [Arthrobacter sp. H5]